jgi:4-amino-4-deoxy-L-arabinose transferase-like glycosyltransferase
MPGSRVSRKTVLSVLLLGAAFPYFINLGASSIWDANEAFYAETPREMMDASDYVNPSFNFQLRYNKPVLSYWEVAAAYHVFGVSEQSERLPIAIGGMVLIATAFGLGRLVGGTEAGLLASLVLATSPRVMLLARRIIIDVNLAMFTGLVLLLFALSEIRPKRRLYLVLMYVAAGLGVLTKGPVAVLLPALAFLIYLSSERRLGDIRRMMLPSGAAIGLAIVLPWYYLVYRLHGWEYIRAFIVGENLDRYAQTIGEPARGILFYLPVMLADLFPWSLFIPLALFWAFRQRSSRVVRLLLVWIAAIVVFFSLSGTKEDLYILPIVPAEAALVGAVIARSFDRLTAVRSTRWFSVATALMLFLTGAAAFWAFAVAHRYSLQGASVVAVVAVVGGAAALMVIARRQIFAAASTVAGTLVVISWCVVLWALPDFERYKPVRPFADVIRSRASVGGIVGYYGFALPSMVYYLHRPIMEVVLPDHLRAVFYSTSDVYFVMPEADYEAVKERLPVRTYVLARQPMFDLRAGNFLQGSELPQFVLISNRSGDAPSP